MQWVMDVALDHSLDEIMCMVVYIKYFGQVYGLRGCIDFMINQKLDMN